MLLCDSQGAPVPDTKEGRALPTWTFFVGSIVARFATKGTALGRRGWSLPNAQPEPRTATCWRGTASQGAASELRERATLARALASKPAFSLASILFVARG